MTMVINSLTASVGQEFGCGLAGWLWHGVSHAGVTRRLDWGCRPHFGGGPLTGLLAGPQCLCLWDITQECGHRRQGSPRAVWGHLPERRHLPVLGASAYHRAAPHHPLSRKSSADETLERRLSRLPEDRRSPGCLHISNLALKLPRPKHSLPPQSPSLPASLPPTPR